MDDRCGGGIASSSLLADCGGWRKEVSLNLTPEKPTAVIFDPNLLPDIAAGDGRCSPVDNCSSTGKNYHHRLSHRELKDTLAVPACPKNAPGHKSALDILIIGGSWL